MMAVLFAFFVIALLLALFQNRRWSIIFFVIGLVLSLLMFWHHATDILKINL